jgi:GT2 family glycosyltransferase
MSGSPDSKRAPVAPAESIVEQAVEGMPRGPVKGLRRRIYLTYHYLGWRTLLLRAVTFPLRVTPLGRRLRLGPRGTDRDFRRARAWYREHGRPVTIVIPSYRDHERVRALVKSIKRTVPRGMARVIVADDASGPEHLAALRRIKGIEVVAGEQNRGFAVNVNRGLRAAEAGSDVVLLNSDVEAQRGWLACLQYAARRERVGIVGAQLLYPDGRIQSGGSVRNRDAREWFDHRYRFKPANWGPACVAGPVLALTGACMYITRRALDRVGLLDERYAMAYEDVDLCLRTWQAGLSVLYFPAARLVHHESVTRGTALGEREASSQQRFWERWAEFLDGRRVSIAEGKLRVAYVTEDTGIGGGHRDVFEHLNRLLERGHDVSLYTLGQPPDWFELRAPVRSFHDFDELTVALAELDAIKVATWWTTAMPVWRASVVRGIPVYFVQDIETSYYPDNERRRHQVLDSYRPEFRYMTISSWNRDRLGELGLDAELVPPGIDLDSFRPLARLVRRSDMVLALGRSNPLKNLPLTLDAWRALPEPRPELCLFGIEPGLAEDPSIRYVVSPSDEQVNELFNRATAFVQTSVHEGFALPPLEAMATGAAVVCTDAHGNRDFCADGENCLMCAPEVADVSAALARVLADPSLRARLGQAGVRTAQAYAWSVRIDQLERFLTELANSPRARPAGEVAPAVGGAPT